MKRRIFVTTALPYANGSFHIGHIMEYIQADIWVRFQRMQGHEVHFVCADDAHGAPIMLKAEAEGVTPQAARRPHRRRAQDISTASTSPSTTGIRPIRLRIPSCRRTSTASSRRRASSTPSRSSSSTTRSRACSLPTATSKASAPSAARRINTATPARCAARSMRLPT